MYKLLQFPKLRATTFCTSLSFTPKYSSMNTSRCVRQNYICFAQISIFLKSFVGSVLPMYHHPIALYLDIIRTAKPGGGDDVLEIVEDFINIIRLKFHLCGLKQACLLDPGNNLSQIPKPC